jgi:hypothetical protein
MTYASTNERAALIGGLRALAHFLESNPHVPAPIHSDVFTFPPDGDWDATCAEIDTIASGHGVTGHKALGGHYIAAKSFGSIQYRAVAIPHSNPVDSEQSR